MQGGDEIVRVGDVAVADFRAFAAEVARHPGEPLRITVKRPIKTNSDGVPESAASRPSEWTFEIPVLMRRSFGLVMKMGPITAVQIGSPAAAAGLKKDDVITAVDGKSLSAADAGESGWNPDTLPELMRQAAAAGKTVVLTVLRAQRTSENSACPIRRQPREA